MDAGCFDPGDALDPFRPRIGREAEVDAGCFDPGPDFRNGLQVWVIGAWP